MLGNDSSNNSKIAKFLIGGAMLAVGIMNAPAAMAQEQMPKCISNWVAQGAYTEFNGHKIFVHASGPISNEGVLIVHGYPGSSWDFSGVVGPVAEKTRVVVPDMVGFGHSDTPLTGTFKDNFSLLKQADLYEHVALAEGLETVILVAHDMGQTVGLELMARQEEGKLPFRIKHAILLNGSTVVDLVELTEGQKKSLALPDKALEKAVPMEDWVNDISGTYGATMQANEAAHKEALDCQVAQIYANDGALVMSNIVRYLLERKEFYNRWVGTFSGFHSAPLSVFWGLDDPVALPIMAQRMKAWRPETDLYMLEGVGHWPSIEAPEVISEAILHRLPSE